MNFEIKGKGHPLMLISGIASDMSAWSLQVPSYALNFMTICLDNRGSGKTEAPEVPYSIETMANDAARLLDVIGAECSHVMGFGMGSRVALEMAIRHPSKVKGLVLCSGAPKAVPSERLVLQTLWSKIEKGEGREELARYEASWVLSEKFFRDERVAQGVAMVRMARMKGTPLHAHARQIEAVLDYDCTEHLGQVRAPTLVVGGSRDRMVPIQYQREMAEAIPGAKFLSLDAAHTVMAEAPKDYNESTLRFLAEQGI